MEEYKSIVAKGLKNSIIHQVLLEQSVAEMCIRDRANEGAIKLARKYFREMDMDKYEIITLENSFHGRTMSTLAATGQQKYQLPYKPLTPGFKHVEFNNLAALEKEVRCV